MVSSESYNNNQSEQTSEQVRKIKQGDLKAYEVVFKAFWNPLLNFSYSIVKDKENAENIVQDTFLFVWEKRAELNADKNFKTYLFTIVRNKSLNQMKSHAESKRGDEKELFEIENGDSANSPVEQNEISQSIQKAIEILPHKSREIFMMNRFDHLTYKEISEILEISIKTVETQMGRVLKKLRESLKHLMFLVFF